MAAMRFFLLIVILPLGLFSDVKSNSGRILFEVDGQGSHEAELNLTGLGIGVTPQANLHVSGNSQLSSKLSIGGSLTENNLHLNGSLSLLPLLQNGGNVLLNEHSLLIMNTENKDGTVQLPASSEVTGRIVKIKKTTGAGNLFITATGNLIDQNSHLVISSNINLEAPNISLISDGEQWWILSYTGPTLGEIGSSNVFIAYQLNEISGATANDGSSQNRNAILTNAHSFSGNSVSAPVGKGLRLDEAEDQLNYDHGSDFLDNVYSWSLWVNVTIDPETNPTTNPAEPSAEVIGFNWSSDNVQWQKTVFQKQNDNSFVRAQLTTDLDANTWYHIAATWDGTTLKAYLNGELEASEAASTIKTSSGNLNLSNPGSETSSSTSFDVFQFFNRTLSAQEIYSLYTSGNP
jgi:hypothetical protein